MRDRGGFGTCFIPLHAFKFGHKFGHKHDHRHTKICAWSRKNERF